MKEGNTLFLDRTDLKDHSMIKPIQEIALSDFKGDKWSFHNADTIIYNDIIHTLVLKNRYGKMGEVKK